MNIGNKHGLRFHPLYNTWVKMKSRCYDKKDIGYKNYGERGISVCAEWIHRPQDFIKWSVENGYKKGLQLDRKENNGNYEPSNCRWVSSLENGNNKRTNRVITYNGEALTLSQWIRKLGLTRETISSRLNQGWPEEKALSTPIRKKKKAA
jgi:hypothetical protein